MYNVSYLFRYIFGFRQYLLKISLIWGISKSQECWTVISSHYGTIQQCASLTLGGIKSKILRFWRELLVSQSINMIVWYVYFRSFAIACYWGLIIIITNCLSNLFYKTNWNQIRMNQKSSRLEVTSIWNQQWERNLKWDILGSFNILLRKKHILKNRSYLLN